MILHQKVRVESVLYDERVIIRHGTMLILRVIIILIHLFRLIFVKPSNINWPAYVPVTVLHCPAAKRPTPQIIFIVKPYSALINWPFDFKCVELNKEGKLKKIKYNLQHFLELNY